MNGWEQVDRDTHRRTVPGGWLYQVIEREGDVISTAAVFVPNTLPRKLALQPDAQKLLDDLKAQLTVLHKDLHDSDGVIGRVSRLKDGLRASIHYLSTVAPFIDEGCPGYPRETADAHLVLAQLHRLLDFDEPVPPLASSDKDPP